MTISENIVKFLENISKIIQEFSDKINDPEVLPIDCYKEILKSDGMFHKLTAVPNCTWMESLEAIRIVLSIFKNDENSNIADLELIIKNLIEKEIEEGLKSIDEIIKIEDNE
jgi:hypothetical protein